MEVTAIKFNDGTYYAGCNKRNSKTLLGAQLYKSEKAAENVINNSVNFPFTMRNRLELISVTLCETSELESIRENNNDIEEER